MRRFKITDWYHDADGCEIEDPEGEWVKHEDLEGAEYCTAQDRRALEVLTDWLLNDKGETDLIEALDFWDGVDGRREGRSR